MEPAAHSVAISWKAALKEATITLESYRLAAAQLAFMPLSATVDGAGSGATVKADRLRLNNARSTRARRWGTAKCWLSRDRQTT